MKIYGAGMAGLLAANMLRRHKPVIYEAQSDLPHNHDALLRFRSDVVSRATGIPFRRVTVDKVIYYQGRYITRPTLNLNNMYSQKVTGEYRARSISDLRTAERYVAPPNFIEQMARSCYITYDARDAVRDSLAEKEPFISTIPMPAMMNIVGWDRPAFNYNSIWSVAVSLHMVDLFQTIYYPGPEVRPYRASITGNRLIIEYVGFANECPEDARISDDIRAVCKSFGLLSVAANVEKPVVKFHEYGKLTPIEEGKRRSFMSTMTDKYQMYSLGRFATWRQILMDDIVKDVTTIERWMVEPDSYKRRLES